MEPIHIGKKIAQVFATKDLSVSEFGRRLNTSRENIYGIFSRESIGTAMLQKISVVLEYDFFKFFSKDTEDSLHVSEIKRLRQENEYLKEIIRLLKENKMP